MNNNRRNINIPPMNARFLDSSDDEESEDEETRLEREEAEEQERLLSKQFGEAQETNLGKRKGEDDDIEAEYSSSRKPKKKRHVLTPAMLTSAHGLLRVKSEFPRNIRWNPTSSKNKVQAAALYSRTLVNSYKSFCYDLFPSMAFSDVLVRMETFGSKKEVKEYLQHLRQDVCRAHLERLYGKEQAERMMQELQHGLEAQQHQHGMDEFYNTIEEQHQGGGGYPVQRGPALDGISPTEDNTVSGGEGTGNKDVPPVSTTTNTSEGAAIATDESTANSRPTEDTTTRPTTATTTTTTTRAAVQNNDNLQDSDDELEFVVSTKPTPVNPFADDDDDDSDEEEQEEAIMATTAAAVSKTATLDKEEEDDDDVEMENEDDATVVVTGFQTNTNQETRRQDESKATSQGTTPTTLHDAQETNDNDDDMMEEEEPQNDGEEPQDDENTKVNVLPQETQQDSPASFSSNNETATIVPTSLSESQLDNTVATQGEETSTQMETPTQLESPGEENEEATHSGGILSD